jgi:hypothetical protein
LNKNKSDIEYGVVKEKEWVPSGEEPVSVTEDVDIPEEYA